MVRPVRALLLALVLHRVRDEERFSHPGVDCSSPADYYLPYIDLIGPGDVRFGVEHHPVSPSGCGNVLGDVPPGDTYRLVVNPGSIRPREIYGHIRDVKFAIGAGAWSARRSG